VSTVLLSAAARSALERLAADLTRVLGDRFASLVAYGANTSAAFATTLTAEDLDALSVLVERWHRDGLATPLVMTEDELRRSLDTFPLEYQAMIDHHVVIAGRDPFAGAAVSPEDLRRACEAHARGHLIHLRQGWLQAAGHDEHLAELVERSAAPLRALLASVARLDGSAADSSADLARFAEGRIGLPRDLVEAVLGLEARSDGGGHRVAQRMSEYLAAAERLWAFVDEWRRA
jgi:hypothetical protein